VCEKEKGKEEEECEAVAAGMKMLVLLGFIEIFGRQLLLGGYIPLL
jgi:hypothetical protein